MGNYYLGLDIGTNSVGWAVTDENYNIERFKKKNMWGIRLFDEAKTAESRRIHRQARRMRQRKIQRLNLLMELFDVEISKVDESFFIRKKRATFIMKINLKILDMHYLTTKNLMTRIITINILQFFIL